MEVTDKTDIAKIKEPTRGKKMNAEEFALEREKLFKEMQENSSGGNRIMIRNWQEKNMVKEALWNYQSAFFMTKK